MSAASVATLAAAISDHLHILQPGIGQAGGLSVAFRSLQLATEAVDLNVRDGRVEFVQRRSASRITTIRP